MGNPLETPRKCEIKEEDEPTRVDLTEDALDLHNVRLGVCIHFAAPHSILYALYAFGDTLLGASH